MSWISVAAAAIPAAINLGQAAHQKHQANKLAKTPRPEYQIPQAFQEALNNAKYQAGQTELPGQNIMLDRLGRNTSNGIADLKNVSTSPIQLGANVAKLYGNQMNATNDIGIAAAQNWMANQGQLRNQLNNMGQQQQFQWDYNVNQPYQNKVAASSALREGASRNLYAAGTDIAAIGAGIGNYQNALGDKSPNFNSASGTTPFASQVTNPQNMGSYQIPVKPKMNMTDALSTGTSIDPTSQQYNQDALDEMIKVFTSRNYRNNNQDYPY